MLPHVCKHLLMLCDVAASHCRCCPQPLPAPLQASVRGHAGAELGGVHRAQLRCVVVAVPMLLRMRRPLVLATSHAGLPGKACGSPPAGMLLSSCDSKPLSPGWPHCPAAGIRLPAQHVEDAASAADFYANKVHRLCWARCAPCQLLAFTALACVAMRACVPAWQLCRCTLANLLVPPHDVRPSFGNVGLLFSNAGAGGVAGQGSEPRPMGGVHQRAAARPQGTLWLPILSGASPGPLCGSLVFVCATCL